MVKIPSFDELKKLGSGLVDQVKAGIDSANKKAPVTVGDDALNEVFKGLFVTLNEIIAAQATQVNAVKKMERELEVLAKIVETYQKPAAKPADNPEEPKSS